MIKVVDITVSNMENALRGLRNPMNSWANSDSYFGLWHEEMVDEVIEDYATDWTKFFFPKVDIFEKEDIISPFNEIYSYLRKNALNPYYECAQAISADVPYEYMAYVGPNDMKLACNMIRAGADEGKFARQIFVSMDIIAPLYWWKEMDTYKVATVANSTSTMHKIHSKPLTEQDFSIDDSNISTLVTKRLIDELNFYRERFLETKDKNHWRALIQLLPESYMQKRTWTANYQVLRNIYFARQHHKLQEWRDFCDIIKTLPYATDLIIAK